MIVLYALQRLQYFLPFNPQKLAGVSSHSSFNTAASFTTNTNWQGYGGEVTMSYLSQMAGLAYQNFVSAAVGMALAIAFIRGIARREKDALGPAAQLAAARVELEVSEAEAHVAGGRGGHRMRKLTQRSRTSVGRRRRGDGSRRGMRNPARRPNGRRAG